MCRNRCPAWMWEVQYRRNSKLTVRDNLVVLFLSYHLNIIPTKPNLTIAQTCPTDIWHSDILSGHFKNWGVQWPANWVLSNSATSKNYKKIKAICADSLLVTQPIFPCLTLKIISLPESWHQSVRDDNDIQVIINFCLIHIADKAQNTLHRNSTNRYSNYIPTVLAVNLFHALFPYTRSLAVIACTQLKFAFNKGLFYCSIRLSHQIIARQNWI